MNTKHRCTQRVDNSIVPDIFPPMLNMQVLCFWWRRAQNNQSSLSFGAKAEWTWPSSLWMRDDDNCSCQRYKCSPTSFMFLQISTIFVAWATLSATVFCLFIVLNTKSDMILGNALIAFVDSITLQSHKRVEEFVKLSVPLTKIETLKQIISF